MKNIYKLMAFVLVLSIVSVDALQAQAPTPISVKDLHAYDVALESQTVLPTHPLNGQLVSFDAVVVSYPKNSGLATPNNFIPGRIHVFVTDVNAVTSGADGMSIQIVVDGVRRETLEGLSRGDVISIEGNLAFFGNVSQFNATEVTFLGNVFIDEAYEALDVLLAPTVVSLSQINIPSETDGRHRWNSAAYSNYNHRYVKLEGLEVVGRIDSPTGRPWLALSDGTTIIYTTDTSLRFRNDRGFGYAYNADTEQGLGYNWRRLAEGLDGPYTPPPTGAVVDIAGYIVVNTFNPAGFDESNIQSTLKIAPWDDGVIWTQDGDDPAFRISEDWPNDLVVLGFAPLIDNVVLDTTGAIVNTTEVGLTFDVVLPEVDYTLGEVSIAFTALPYTADEATEVVQVLTPTGGNSYSFAFGSYADFTEVSYVITANASTPGMINTKARLSGSFSVTNASSVSPPTFSPSTATFENIGSVTLTSATAGASIYYTLDGTTPTTASTLYSGAISLTSSATISAIATAEGLTNSPVNSRTYVVESTSVPVNNLRDLRENFVSGVYYEYTGTAVVTFTQSNRNQKYLMDATGGILIDDSAGRITSSYTVGDQITGLVGSISVFNGLRQFIPLLDPGPSPGTADVVPVDITLADIDLSVHESSLVRIEGVTINASGNFVVNTNYQLSDASLAEGTTVPMRTSFGQANYIGQPITEGKVTLTAIVNRFNANPQLTPRSDADIIADVSVDFGDAPIEFALKQNYPNPFNPTTNIVYSLAESADVKLVVYDILGRRVATLVNELQTEGIHTINFNASSLASGTYIYRIEAGSFVSVKKMILIK
jgi:hypothetical protein